MKKKEGNLPNGWGVKPVSAVVDINPRMKLPPKDSDGVHVPMYEMAAIDEDRGILKEPQMVPLGSGRSGKTKFTTNDILFAKITPCVQNGKCAFVQDLHGGLGFGSSEFYVLRASTAVLPQYLFYFLRQRRVVEAAVQSFTGSSGRQRVPSTFWDTLQLPIPPLPVQTRVATVLQLADEILQKCREAYDLAVSVLPATFQDMFGDPAEAANLQPLRVGIESIRNGISRRRKTIANEGQVVLRIQDVGDALIDFEDVNRIALSDKESGALTLQRGDMLMVRVNGNPDLVGRNALFESYDEPVAHNDHLMRVRFKHDIVLPEYVAAYLRTPFGRHELRSKVVTSAGNHSINQDGIAAVRIPIPPLKRQVKFLDAVRQHQLVLERLLGATKAAQRTFASLLGHAFTGHLTASWETAQATTIQQQQQVNEEIPRLIATDIAQNVGDLGVSLTAMMKLMFLIQMKGTAKRRFYEFVPYHYGPFAKELYADLEKLQEDGLISIDNGDEDKTRITLADPAKAKELTDQLPEELREDVQAIIDEYGGLKHNELLDRVYEEFPAYAKKSRRKKVAKKTSKKASRRRKKE